ncbi:MAG: response regulator [Verrucomicrobiae bacterium]|nr:response regulator [Verrucomicrobiae bacterium]
MTSCLIVDDSDVVRKVLRTVIENLDMRVIEAASVAKAAELCEIKLPDAVVLDWNIPGENPLAFVSVLREEAASDRLKILYVMTNQEPTDIAKAKAAGVDDILQKPFHRVQLEAKLLGLITPKPTDVPPVFSTERPLTRAGVAVRFPTLRKAASV